MRGARAVFLLECFELAPLAIPAVVVAAFIGAAAGRVAVMDATLTLAISAVALGIWQGWLDRRFGANAFRRHRPVPGARVAIARWSAGLFGLTLIMASFFLAWSIGEATRNTPTPVSVLHGRTDLVLLIGGWALLNAIAFWCAVRFTVSIPNIVAAIVWTAILPPVVVTATVAAPGRGYGMIAVLAVVFSVYQGLRLSRPNLGGAM